MIKNNLEDLTESTVVEASDNVLVYAIQKNMHRANRTALGEYVLSGTKPDGSIELNCISAYLQQPRRTTKIFILDGKHPIQIAERDNRIWSLCYNDGTLYDSGYVAFDENFEYVGMGLYETLTGERIDEKSGVLVSHNDTLVSAGPNGILETLTGSKIAERDGCPRSFCSHEGELYASGSSGIYNTLTGERIAKRRSPVWALASHKGELYDSTPDGIYNTFTGEKIAETNGCVRALVSHEGELYAASDFGIYNTFTGETISELITEIMSENRKQPWHKRTAHREILSMASVPRSIFEESGLLEQKISILG